MATDPKKKSSQQPQKGSAVKKANQPKKNAKPVYTEEDIDYDYERSVKFANRGCLVAFASVFAVAAVVLLWVFIYITGELGGRHATVKGAIELELPPGSTRNSVGTLLKDNGLIADDRVFRFYVRFNGISGYQPGRYTLEGGMSYEEILNIICVRMEDREEIRVTFPEGRTIWQYAEICEKAGLCTVDEFIDEAQNGDFSDIEFLQNIDYDTDTYMRLEGYLAPNTYDFFKGETPHNIIRKLLKQFNAELNSMTFTTGQGEVDFYTRLQQQDISLRDAVTLASMVEEEASNPDRNQGAVAGVFWNRLRGDINTNELPRRTLGSDVTYYYVSQMISRSYGGTYESVPENLRYAYIALDIPESREGLPVGPICNPSLSAIKAALQPEQHNFYYFLTDLRGNYYYAETYKKHQVNVAEMEKVNAEVKKEQEGQENTEDGESSSPPEN